VRHFEAQAGVKGAKVTTDASRLSAELLRLFVRGPPFLLPIFA